MKNVPFFFILLLWYFVYFIKLIVFEHFYFFKKKFKIWSAANWPCLQLWCFRWHCTCVCVTKDDPVHKVYLYIAAPERELAPPSAGGWQEYPEKIASVFPLRVHHLLKKKYITTKTCKYCQPYIIAAMPFSFGIDIVISNGTLICQNMSFSCLPARAADRAMQAGP